MYPTVVILLVESLGSKNRSPSSPLPIHSAMDNESESQWSRAFINTPPPCNTALPEPREEGRSLEESRVDTSG